MSEHRPPRRPGYGRDHAAARTPDDRERREQARRAAEALFAPKPPGSGQLADRSPPSPLASVPARRLTPIPAIAPARDSEPPPAKAIPAAHLARMRTLLKYGMTIVQVAELYGADVGEIKRALRKI